jgi:hypothetical protein
MENYPMHNLAPKVNVILMTVINTVIITITENF